MSESPTLMSYPLSMMFVKQIRNSFALLLLGFSSLVVAHHAMEVHYLIDDEAIVVKEGIVKNFSLLDPHSYLVVTVEEEGESSDWILEGQSRVVLTRSGWRFDMLNPGASVVFTAYPARSGETVGRILSIEVDGELYCSDRCDLLGIEKQEISQVREASSVIAVSVVSD